MTSRHVSRRDFNRLTLAALGGALSGAALSGCGLFGGKPEAEIPGAMHGCRGLNACKGQGTGGNNDCAGMGNCATAKAHSCKGQNDCKGQGGCGENPGQNDCKGQGGCAVPLKPDAWAKARKSFEEAMSKADREFGKAPQS